MSDSVPLNDTNELSSFLLNPDASNTANVEETSINVLSNVEETSLIASSIVEETSSIVEETSSNVLSNVERTPPPAPEPIVESPP